MQSVIYSEAFSSPQFESGSAVTVQRERPQKIDGLGAISLGTKDTESELT